MKLTRAAPRISSSNPGYICNICLRSRSVRTLPSARPYSTTKNPPPPPSTAYTLLSSRRLISLSGPDATRFLQGAITANLSPSTVRTSGFYAAFLNAQGRVLHDVFVYPEFTSSKGGWLIEVDANEVEKLARHIKRYKLRAKFDVRVLGQGERDVWSVWKDETAERGWTAHPLALDEGQAGAAKEREVGCLDTRAPGMGRRVILPGGVKPEADGDETVEESYRVRRYLKGVPEGQGEIIKEAALPQESNVDFLGGIDFRKGCYVGQELTIRTHHTGVVRKRILPVMLYGKDEPIPQALEYFPDKNLGTENIPRETSISRVEKRGRSAGKFLTGVGNIGLGLCRLEIMTDVQVQGEAGGYKEGDEFKLVWELEGGTTSVAKIKAFVPSWHLTKQ